MYKSDIIRNVGKMKIIAKIRENGKIANSAVFRDFEQENSALRIPQQTVTRIIAELSQNAHMSEMGKFRNFEQENSALRI